MTKQILLKTPRGNTAVIPVDHFVAEARANAASSKRPTLVLSSEDEETWHTGSTIPRPSNKAHFPTTEVEEDAAAIAAAVDTSRFFEDNACEDLDRQSKEDLLLQLIGASKRRDVGRKRNLRTLYNLEVEDEEDERRCMEVDGHSMKSKDPSEPQKVTNRFDQMDINREQEGGSFKIRRRYYSISSTRPFHKQNKNSPNIGRRRQRSGWSPADPVQQKPVCHDTNVKMSTVEESTSHVSCQPPLRVAFYHQGRKVSLDRIWDWITGSASNHGPSLKSNAAKDESYANRGDGYPQFPLYLTLSTSVRLLGGIDRQNRVGSKFGGGGVSSSQNAERERKERLKQLALESIDLAKDPYLMRNHLGTYECKLCLTLHTNEANYLAHTQGKKHQAGLAKRAHMEKLRKEREEQLAEHNNLKRLPTEQPQTPRSKVPKIGRPAYQVFKSKDPETDQRCLSFELTYKDIAEGIQPRHRFMSAFEQRVESFKDKRYQYVLFAAEPYETIAFKIPNEPLDRNHGRLITHWDTDDKKFSLTLYFADSKEETKSEDPSSAMDTDGTSAVSPFAAALTGR